MSTESKQLFVRELSKILGDKMTAAQLGIVGNAVADLFPLYDIERRADDDACTDFNEVLKTYIDTKRIEGRSEKTLERYQYVLQKLHEGEPCPVKDMTVFTIRRFMSKEKDRGLSDRTLRGYRDVFCAFFGWLHGEGLIPANPCANLNPIKCRKEVRVPYSDVEIERMKEACNCQRDKAIVMFLLSTGCRIGEVCGLNMDDVDLDSMECTVLGKGNKERTVYMDSVAAMQLKAYLDTRTDSSDALFVGKGTNRLQPGGVRHMLNVLGTRAGVTNVHPHRFRRTLATGLINHGMPIQEVANILGHEKIDTTMTYVYIDKRSVKSSYQKYSR